MSSQSEADINYTNQICEALLKEDNLTLISHIMNSANSNQNASLFCADEFKILIAPSAKFSALEVA